MDNVVPEWTKELAGILASYPNLPKVQRILEGVNNLRTWADETKKILRVAHEEACSCCGSNDNVEAHCKKALDLAIKLGI